MDEDDEGEFWRAVKEESRKKKQGNLHNSIAILDSRGIAYQQFSPVHFRVGDYDYWPSTGKFWNQKTGEKGRGVFNLIKRINAK